MNELYAESGVKRKEDIKTIGIRVALIVLVFISFFVASLSSFLVILPAIAVLAVIYIFPKLSIEYEYVFCDGQLDFDMIMGKAKRKNILKMDMDQVEIVAPVNSHAIDSYKNGNYIKKNYTSLNENAKVYVIVGKSMKKDDSKSIIVYFEPSEKMISCMKQKSPRKVSAC